MTGVLEALVVLALGGAFGYGLWCLRAGRGWAVGAPVGSGLAYLAMRLGGLPVPQAAASGVFLFAYLLIASEKVHKTKVALAGAATMLLLGLVDQHTALHGKGEVEGTDWNTIFLLVGMMIIVSITRHTGVFQWIAIKCARLAKGNPVVIMLLLSLVTAVLSAALDNVTTVLLIAPVAILICQALSLEPVPILIMIVLASNIGGTATLIGDPPNIMIASSARLTFSDFLRVDAPIILIVMAFFCLTAWLAMRRKLVVTAEARRLAAEFDASQAITDRPLLVRCLAVIGLVLVGFGAHGALHLEPATIAMGGAAALLLLHRGRVEDTLREVEWPTIFFFVGLFIMVSALVEVGVVKLLGKGIITLTCGTDLSGGLTSGQRLMLTLGVLWFSGIASGIVDNIPFVATMNAVIHDMARAVHPSPDTASFSAVAHAPDIYPLWWALSLGACLGGNFTLIGASANVVVAGIAERSKHPITFGRFLRYGVPLTFQALVLCSVYLWLRFLR
jgi:Na+/H+ antiporter NhaD/arsenite permease-like protein